jgi:ABC-2 type transport system ATP-binding protein
MIKIENVTKIYPNGHQALNDLNLEISTGMFGLLGPNGAGKTTLMRILATLLRPTNGRISILGNDLSTSGGQDQTRNLLGYLPQETGLHPALTVEQELDYIAILKQISNGSARAKHIDKILEQVGLSQARRKKVNMLSGGMKRRLGIALALLGEPQLIIVDEPTAGLDPAERVRFRNLLHELAGDRIVILSTHIIEDVSQICTDLAVLHEGSLLFRGSPDELTKQAEGMIWITPETTDNAFIISSKRTNDGIENRVFSDTAPGLSSRLAMPTLEDAYLWLIRQSEAQNICAPLN